MAKRISYNEINNLSEDWALDERNGYPYSGQSVQNFIKRMLNTKAGEFYYDADTSKYLVFADVDSRDLFLSDREEHADLLIGSFDAPANFTAEIHVSTPASNIILSGTTGNYFDFTFDIKSKSGSSTGESVVANYAINNSGNIKKITQIYTAGTSVHFLLDPYLANGANSISVVITGRDTFASTMASINYTVVNLKLESTFDFSVPVVNGSQLAIPYSLEGAGVKYVEWYIDGNMQSVVDNVSELRANRTKYIDTGSLIAGKHNLQVRAYITNNEQNYYSTTLYYDFVVSPANGVWEDNTTAVLLGVNLSALTISTLTVTAIQYEKFDYKLAIFDSRERSLPVAIKDNGTQVQSIAMEPLTVEDLSYTPVTTGTHVLLFDATDASASITANVSAGNIDIAEETDQLVLKLSAKDRSNNEVNPAVWTYGAYSTTFNNFLWNTQSGWNNNALIIQEGSSIAINIAPLTGNVLTTGKTIEIEYEAVNITNENAAILSLVNSQTNAGFELTASSAKLQSSGGAVIDTKFRDGDKIHLTAIINKTTGDNGRLIFFVNNGILERAASFAPADSFRVDNTLVIGSTGCTVKLYSIRVYDKALSVDEAFCNYAVDSPDLIEIANNNDILDSSTGMIDADKVNAKIPIMIITGDMQPIFDATSSSATVYVDVEYRNLQDATKNFTATHLRMRPQGTSSLGYPRKNLRLYTASKYDCVMTDANGEVLEDGLYAFKEKAQPVNCWTLKADYAESSGSHNTGVARMWNDVMYNAQVGNTFPLRTAAQVTAKANDYDYDVRTTIDGFPIVVFNRLTESSELVCLGQYNFNNDKSTEKVFGFTDIPGFDNTNVQCFEFLANENPICLFSDISDFDNSWADAFESRYPDTTEPNLVPLKTLATWINSCKNNQSKWNSEKSAHFDIPKLCAYYVYLMRFGAVDQTVKNAMITTEDGIHWFFINYDNDTVMGIDNISSVLNAWDYDRQSIKPSGAYYFAGHESVLWNCFEADSECMSMVSTIDNAIYSAGLTYANMLRMFDNEQCDKWCERLYNDNGNYKYIQPYKDSGAAVLYMLQGSRESYRHWWLQHRMDLYDAKFASGAFRSRVIRFIAEGAPGGTFSIVSGNDTYYGYGINNVMQGSTVYVASDASHSFTISQTLAIGDPVYLYNANNAKEIDLSDFISYLSTLYVNQAIGTGGTSSLKSIILGDGTNTNNRLTEIGGLNIIAELEELDIRGFAQITSIDLSGLPSLHTFKATGSGLTSFAPASGAAITLATLPASLQSLTLDENVVTDITYTPTTTLRSVTIDHITGTWDDKTFVNTWLALLSDAQLAQADITLLGIAWDNMTAAQAINIGKVGTKRLQGSITLVSLTQEEYTQLVALFGENAFIEGGSFTINAPASVLLTGPTQILEGTTGKFTASVFPITSSTITYLLYNGSTLITAQTDGQGRVYRTYGGVTLYEATGDVSVVSGISNNVTLKVRARLEEPETYSDFFEFTAEKLTYPSSVTISGNASIDHNAAYNYTKSFNTNNFNASVTNVAWSLTTSSACSLTASDDNSATVTVTNTPATAETVTLTCTVTFTGNVTKTGTKSITLQLTYPSSLSITGNSTLDTNGTFDYTKSFNTNSFTASVLNVAWSLSTNTPVTLKSSTDTTATLEIANGNASQITVTLTCTATLTGNVTREGTKSITVAVIDPPPTINWVDLGLPSGLLWCTSNVGANSETASGLFFAWGETTGYATAAARNTALGLTGGFDDTSYNAGTAASISTNLTFAQDAAHTNMGGIWRMPAKEEFQELYDNTDYEMVNDYIPYVNGIKFMKKSDHNVYIFIPFPGYYSGNNKSNDKNIVFSWGTSISTYGSSKAYSLYVNRTTPYIYPVWSLTRSTGCSIRAVMDQPKLVDLGLPSGTLWADRNLGASSETETGLYFAWGETTGYFNGADRNAILGTTDGFNTTSYRATGANSISADLTASKDAATVNLGSPWRMPTKADFEELYNTENTDGERVTLNGIDGYKFMKKSDHSVYVFLPASGMMLNQGQQKYGYDVHYWTTKYASSGYAYDFVYYVSNGIMRMYDDNRTYGIPIRPVQ